MRTPQEIAFRLRQEAANLALWGRPPSPSLAAPPCPLPQFPDPREVARKLQSSGVGKQVRQQIRQVTEQVLSGQLPALGLTLNTGPDIRWRKDYVSGRETEPVFFRRIPYLDPQQAGDHKVIWEINRHQHLVALAQETLFEDAHPGAAPEVARQLESWLEANPFQRGINWTSALEVAFRALSWIWIQHLAGNALPEDLRQRFWLALYRHGLHLEYNLSVYFSPNTHLLGEALVLYALGAVFPQWPRSAQWKATGARIVEEELGRQVRADGSHFEQSAYYHVYAVDMFLFYAVLAKPGHRYRERLAQMADYLDALLGPSRLLPMFGDDDGGRFFHPYGDRGRWAAETLAACAGFLGRPQWPGFEATDRDAITAWWLIGDEEAGTFEKAEEVEIDAASRLFPDAGVAVMQSNEAHIVADVGPFGPGSGGHSHSDTLSFVARRGLREVLIDPATYTYVGDLNWRERFRSSAAHNTLRINGRNQAEAAGPFRWAQPHPSIRDRFWHSDVETDFLEATVEYAGVLQRRRFVFYKQRQLLLVLDEISDTVSNEAAAQQDPAQLEWFWHPGPEQAALTGPVTLTIGAPDDPAALLTWSNPDSFTAELTAELTKEGDYGWRSPALGVKLPAQVLRIAGKGTLPQQMGFVLDLSVEAGWQGEATLTQSPDQQESWIYEGPQGRLELVPPDITR